jgi:hypothetical protein
LFPNTRRKLQAVGDQSTFHGDMGGKTAGPAANEVVGRQITDVARSNRNSIRMPLAPESFKTTNYKLLT